MTITYTGEVPNGSTFGCFWKILSKWRGSVYKLVWRELLAYLILYYSINFMYRFALNEYQQRVFERIRHYFSQQSETIPMSFVMGFYVSLVVKRWWEQYKLLPWPDTLALFLNAGIPGGDERQRLMRRNIVRYAVLSYVITLQRVSLRVKKRFPTWQHVVDSGLMLESERKIFELMDGKTPMSKYWMPLVWATNIINRARKESLITSDHIVQTLLTELSDIRRRLGALIGYDTVCVPLVYTQVVTLALYTYFISALLGRQFLRDDSEYSTKLESPDMYFPFFTALQFCFYVGWLKVAEVLINPFGEDDDDIELNWLIDRHIKASYMIVDEMHEEHPELLKDQFWDDVVPKELPYTVASEHYRREEPKGSAEKYKVKPQDAVYANLMPLQRKHTMIDDMYADYESVDTPIVQRRKSSNWFTRQISRTRMGSVRSASTAYSSGGLFGRHRGHSVYASPEAGLGMPGGPNGAGAGGTSQIGPNGLLAPPAKISIYDRLVGRRSSGQNQRLAKSVIRSRPRIPTPDVTKEVVDRELRLGSQHHHMLHPLQQTHPPQPHQPISYSLQTHHLHHQHPHQQQLSPLTLLQTSGSYPATVQTTNGTATAYTATMATTTSAGSDMPLVQVVLSPIQELDSGSVNNTLHAGQPGTAALAQAILSPGLGPVLTPVSLPMAQLASLNLSNGAHRTSNSPTFIHTFRAAAAASMPPSSAHNDSLSSMPTLTLTEVTAHDDVASTSSHHMQPVQQVHHQHHIHHHVHHSQSSLTEHPDEDAPDEEEEDEDGGSSGSSHTSDTSSSSTSKRTRGSNKSATTTASIGSTKSKSGALAAAVDERPTTTAFEVVRVPSADAGNTGGGHSIVSYTSDECRSRKTSVASQQGSVSSAQGSTSKRGEVYV